MQVPRQRLSWQRYGMFAILAIGGALVDLATKHWVFAWRGLPDPRNPTYWLIDGLLGITTSLNEGALFGIGQRQVILFVSLSIVAVLAILYFLFVRGAASDSLLTASMGCVFAGILGNLYDRLGLPGLHWSQPFNSGRVGEPVFAVRDWIHFRFPIIGYDWPIFNIADSLLVCGAALLVWHSWRADATKPGDREVDPAGDDAKQSRELV